MNCLTTTLQTVPLAAFLPLFCLTFLMGFQVCLENQMRLPPFRFIACSNHCLFVCDTTQMLYHTVGWL